MQDHAILVLFGLDIRQCCIFDEVALFKTKKMSLSNQSLNFFLSTYITGGEVRKSLSQEVEKDKDFKSHEVRVFARLE